MNSSFLINDEDEDILIIELDGEFPELRESIESLFEISQEMEVTTEPNCYVSPDKKVEQPRPLQLDEPLSEQIVPPNPGQHEIELPKPRSFKPDRRSEKGKCQSRVQRLQQASQKRQLNKRLKRIAQPERYQRERTLCARERLADSHYHRSNTLVHYSYSNRHNRHNDHQYTSCY